MSNRNRHNVFDKKEISLLDVGTSCSRYIFLYEKFRERHGSQGWAGAIYIFPHVLTPLPIQLGVFAAQGCNRDELRAASNSFRRWGGSLQVFFTKKGLCFHVGGT